MNELTKIKDRILARIETYIGDIELAEEQDLTEDEKTIFDSVKHIINEEFEQPIPLPRFIIHANGEMEQVKALNENLKDEEVEKFEKFIDDYKGLPAEDKERICQDAIKTTDAIIRLSQTCGVSYSEAKDVIEESMEMLKKLQTDTDPTYISKLTQKAYEDGKKDGYIEANVSAINTERIIKSTIKEYIGKEYDDVTELLLALNKDLCERIRKENMNGL